MRQFAAHTGQDVDEGGGIVKGSFTTWSIVSVRAVLLESVFPTDTNPQGNLFGGQLVAWMDKAAGIAAMRRAHTTVVTALIENIEFRVPVHVGDLVELDAQVVRVGRTSMLVEVTVRKERPLDGANELCTYGRFTMVALDDHGNPTPVPPIDDGD